MFTSVDFGIGTRHIKCLKPGIKNRNSVSNRVGKSAIFVLNRVRVWGSAPHLPTQGYIEPPPPPPYRGNGLIPEQMLRRKTSKLPVIWLQYSQLWKGFRGLETGQFYNSILEGRLSHDTANYRPVLLSYIDSKEISGAYSYRKIILILMNI